jgi:hypothetical protein
MARVKVTEQNIKNKINLWKNGTNLTDELVFLDSEIDQKEAIAQAWSNNVIVEVVADTIGNGDFKKFVYKEKL